MKIKPPKTLGKLRYVQYSDIAGTLQRQRQAVVWVLLVLVFTTFINVVMLNRCITGQGDWGDWLVTGFMTLGTVVGLRDYLPMLTRLEVGLVCDWGIGYAYLRRDASVASAQWYAFKPETRVEEWKTREGRTWNMQDQYNLAFCEGRKKCFVAHHRNGYPDDTNLEFMRRAYEAFLAWGYRYNREPHKPSPGTGVNQ